MKNKFDVIIFDWDGTLMDSVDWIVSCLQQAAQECQMPVPTGEAARDIIGLSIEESMKILFPGTNSEDREQLTGYYSRHFFSRQIGPKDIFFGVPELLAGLKDKGLLLAVATGKKHAGLMKAMMATGLHNCFDTTRSADQTRSKPHPQMIEEILATLGVDSHRAVMVGDSIHDMQMAHNAGISAIAVECGAHSGAVLKQYDPLLCVQHTGALAEFL